MFPTFDSDRERKLRDVPKQFWASTCRCRKDNSLHYDTKRGLWCCDVCNLPDLFNSPATIASCMGCGNDFVIWTRHKPANFCESCGGDNFAKRGQRNPNEYLEDSYDS